MESFLSLQRSAKAGLAVLLAVALLGWGIVAYSSKRQHENARTLQEALTTLESDAEAKQAMAVELAELRENLAAAEAGLSTRQQEKTKIQAQLAQIEADLQNRNEALAELEAELVALRADREASPSETAPLGVMGAETGVADVADSDDVATLRDRLNATMARLSASAATLAQRDRELAATKADHEAAADRIETLEAELAAFEAAQQDYAAKNQTLADLQGKFDRIEQAIANGTDALAINQQQIADSEARLLELRTETETVQKAIDAKQKQFVEREQQLTLINEAIEAGEQELDQLTSTLTARTDQLKEAEAYLASLKRAQDDTEAEISQLTAELQQREATLADRDDAIADAQTRLEEAERKLAATEERIAQSEVRLNEQLVRVKDREQEIRKVEAGLAALKQNRSTTEAEVSKLKSTIGEQESALEKLRAIKGELEVTTKELSYQKKILSERQTQIRQAGDRLEQLQQAARAATSSGGRTMAQIPLAALSQDKLAVLPIDPIFEPFPTQTPDGIRLTQMHFDLGSAQLTPGGMRKAKEAAAWIKKQGVEKIRLLGFTDSIGTNANNKALAQRRAVAVERVLSAEGVDASRIEIIAKGEEGMREKTPDQTSEPLNRCVGVFISADS